MPNYVRNIVKMKGIADLPLYNERSGEKYFDFQCVPNEGVCRNALLSKIRQIPLLYVVSNNNRCILNCSSQ